MGPNRKRRKRLLIALAAVLLLGGLLGAAYLVREHQLETRAEAGRVAGAQLLKQGDYYNALHKLGPYVRRNPADAEALFEYALARENVPEPNGAHLSDAMSLYGRVLSLRPGHAGAAESLLRLYGLTGFTTETLELTDRLLAGDPTNKVALQARVEALYRVREFESASDFALRMADASPQDVDAQALAFQVLRQVQGGQERILERARSLRESHPGDARFEVLQSLALSLAGQPEEARKWAQEAAGKPVPDVPTLRLLVDRCDRLGMFQMSFELLETAAAQPEADATVRMAFVRRLYELGRFEDVLASTTDREAADDLKIVRSLALIRLHRDDEAAQVAQTITGAWKPVLEQLTGRPENRDAVALMKVCRDALISRSSDPQLRLIAANAFSGVGEGESVVQELEEAARLAPSWAEPLIRLGEASLANAQVDNAIELGEAALDRSPGSLDALYLILSARSQQANLADAAAVASVLEALERFETAAPGDLRAVPWRVRLLADTGKQDDARELTQKTLDRRPAATADTLLHLSAVNRTRELGLEDECLRVCEEVYGLLPPLALARARRLHDAGRTQEAIDFINAVAASAGTHAEATGTPVSDYGVIQAQFLESIGDPGAAAAWVRVAEANSTNVKIQWAALNSPAAQADTAFVARTLSRVKERVGDQGINWRIARARWLVSTEASGSTDGSVAAALILNDVTRESPRMVMPRLLLADALARLENWDGVIEQLTVAAELDPSSVSIALNLATALQTKGDGLRAMAYLQRVLQNPSASLAQRQQAAERAAAAGNPQLAIQALETIQQAGTQPPPDLLLASLYRETRQFDKVDEACLRLLESPDASSLAFVAGYYLSQGRSEQAQAVLAKLDELELLPADESLIRGDFAAQSGDPDAAMTHYRRAIELSPGDFRPWRQLLRSLAVSGRFSDFQASAAEAASALPGNSRIVAVAATAPRATEVAAEWPEVAALLAELLDEPAGQPAVAATLDVLSRFRRSESAGAMLPLRELADANPHFTPLQVLAAEVHLRGGEPDVAARLAGRAMQEDSFDVRAARLTTVALFAAERWSEVVVSSREWKARSPGEAPVADLIASRALVQQGNEREARQIVAGYDPEDIADADVRQRLAIHMAGLAVTSGDYVGAAALLRPMLADVQEVRSAWVALAGGSIGEVDVVVAWLKEVEPLLIRDGFSGQMSLVDASASAHQRLESPVLAAMCRESLGRLNTDAAAGRLLAEAEMQADHWMLIGMLNEKCDDPASAAAAYRHALSLNSVQPVAANNLAMLLRHTDPDEALRLARIAAADEGPNRASFLDTLAAVHEQRGELQSALDSARKAAELAPGSTAIQSRLTRLKAASGESQSSAGGD